MSIRWRVTLLASVAALVVLLLLGFAVVKAHDRALVGTLDDRLRQQADAYIARTGRPGGAVLIAPGDEDSVAQLVRGDDVAELASAATGSDRAHLNRPVAAPPP